MRKLKITLFRYFLQFRSTEYVFMIIMAAIIGGISASGAIAIQYLIKTFEQLFWGANDFPPEYIRSLSWYIKIGVPALGGLLVGCIVYFAREARSGVPEVIRSVALNNGILPPRLAISKLVAASLCIGSGGSVGREGPVIQIGSAIGSAVGQWFRVNPNRMKIFLACGASGGIAAAFNAPIAGALFSLEVILGDFAVAQFSPIVVSAVVATAISWSFLGNYHAFELPKYELLSPYELIFYLILGLIVGFVSVLYIKVLYSFDTFFERLKLHEIFKPLVGGIAIGLIGIVVPQIYGVGYHTMVSALHGEMAWNVMLALIFIKILATAISLGSGGPGGVFAPSLFIGTMTGGFFGALVNMVFPFAASPGAYALVGMGALVAGTTHAAISAILIIFEMTREYQIILPLMITCVISTVLASRLQKESIYTLKLIRRGVNLFQGKEINILRVLPVKAVMTDDPVVISSDTSLPRMVDLFFNTQHTQFFVKNKEGKFVGRVTLAEVRRLLQEEKYLTDIVVAHDIINTNVITVYPDDTLDLVMKIFGRYGIDELPVVDRDDPNKIIGVVVYNKVIEAYNRELIKRDLVQETDTSIKLLEKYQKISFLDGYAIAEVPASLTFSGKTLHELNLRNRFGVNILMIKRKLENGDTKQLIPLPHEMIQVGDHFIAMGKEKELDVLRNF